MCVLLIYLVLQVLIMKICKHEMRKLHVSSKKLPRQHKRLAIVKDLLYGKLKDRTGSDILQFVIPEVLKQRVLQSVHNEDTREENGC